jgi:hypothetical protein
MRKHRPSNVSCRTTTATTSPILCTSLAQRLPRLSVNNNAKGCFLFPVPKLMQFKKRKRYRQIHHRSCSHILVEKSMSYCMFDVSCINCFALTLVVEGFVSGRKIPHSPSSRSELARRSWESDAEKMSRTKTESLRNLTGEWRSRRRVGGGRSRLWKWLWKDVVWLCNWKQTGWMSLPG